MTNEEECGRKRSWIIVTYAEFARRNWGKLRITSVRALFRDRDLPITKQNW